MTSIATANMIKANGHYLNYEWVCPEYREQGPLLTFLHEGLGSIPQWKDFPQQLCEKVNLAGLVYERYGYGNSDSLQELRTNQYLHNYALDELPDLINGLHIVQDIILIGHSDGGSIALIYAAEHPERVKGIITEAAHVFVEDVTSASIDQMLKAYENGDGKLKQQLSRYHGEGTESLFYGWAHTRLKPDFKDWNIEAYLPKINAPVLAIQGIDDKYGTEAQVTAIVEQISGDGTLLMVPDCGHSPHIQATTKTLEGMTSFIQKLGNN
jgi:pimeloyl-ACP methyl ester carboxylesterase